MNKLKFLSLSLCIVLLHGCASGAKFENMAYTKTSSLKYDEELKNDIELSKVAGGDKTNPLWTSEISSGSFQNAIRQSLSNEGLLSENGRFQLEVILTEVDQPLFGLDLEVTTRVSYRLRDTATNNLVLDELIITSYAATMGDAFFAVKRLRLANEGSARNNIEAFLRKLSSLNISPGEVSLSNQMHIKRPVR